MKLVRNIKLLTLFNVFSNFRLYSVIAILYFSQVTHSYALGLSIFSISQIAQALFEVPTGVFSDTIGRQKIILFGAIFNLFAVVCYALGYQYWILVIGAILEGMSRSLCSGNNDALLYETLDQIGQKSNYSEVLGKMHSSLELSGFIATALGGIVAFKSYSLLLWLSVIPQFLCLYVSWEIVEPVRQLPKIGNAYAHLKESLLVFKDNTRLRYLSLATIMQFGVGETSWAFQAAFYKSVLPVWAVGFVMSLNYLMSAISFRLSGRIIAILKAMNVLIYQELYSRTLCLIALLFPTAASPFLMAVASVLYGPGEVAKNTLLQTEFSDRQRATMASLNSLMGSIFFALFAVGMGFWADKLGTARALLIAQLCLVPVLFLYIQVFKHTKLQF